MEGKKKVDQYKNIDVFYLVNLYSPLPSICQHKEKKYLITHTIKKY